MKLLDHPRVVGLAEMMNFPGVLNADPGIILTGPQREFCRTWPNQQEVTVKGLHFIQEDSPGEIAAAILAWHRQLP